jgi:hypothetical protein
MTYTIHDHTEETTCDYCGFPLYVGDKAIEDTRGLVFCSDTCAVISIGRVTQLTSDSAQRRCALIGGVH